jgi:hypothetical protein
MQDQDPEVSGTDLDQNITDPQHWGKKGDKNVFTVLPCSFADPDP